VQLDGHQGATDGSVSRDTAAEASLIETGNAGEGEAASLLDLSPVAANGSCPRPTARGKFLFVGEQKLYVRGSTYGTFRPDGSGTFFPSREIVARDFEGMAANGLNAVRTYTVPPRWLLDTAAHHGLYVMVGIPWEQHVNFLAERGRMRSIEDRVRASVAACAGHPSVLCYAIGNEIPSPIARWQGRRRVERYLARLYRAAKSEDPGGLVTYVNYPPTEYLQLDFLDIVCFNVYLEARSTLESYLARLQNIAAERPLVLAEIGLDSTSHGEIAQAEVLDWQIRSAFEAGCAGGFVFAWTDEWYVSYLSSEGTAAGGLEVDDWDFGLTRRDRTPKPALESVRDAFGEIPFGSGPRWPRISVVVCTHNGSETLAACLTGIRALEYPDFEVVVVNDGSTDSTPEIVRSFGFRLISTDNGGLGTARNIGLQAATGEIVAYLDDDACPDPHWLHYLALGFKDGRFAGIGGPNLPPAESGAVATCVADAPGGPTHVLVSDCEAEHIPGCNMAFRKTALEEVGGFDPQFRVAGDDVDICWRLHAAGQELGFSPAAFVWHQPRGSVAAYWRQQRGYGRAEALLERKWPHKYSAGGHARWSGRLYGRLRAGLGRSRVYYGTWGSELFQSLYEGQVGAFSSLLLGPAWYLVVGMLALLTISAVLWPPMIAAVPLLVAALAVPLVAAGASAARTRVMTRRSLSPHELAGRWLLTTILHVLQPLARMSGRLGGSAAPAGRRARRFTPPLPRVIKTWTEAWRSNVERLAEIESGLRHAGAIVSCGGTYERWDLQARYGLTASVRIRMGVEEHGAGRQLILVHLAPRYSRTALAMIVLLSLLAFAAWIDHVPATTVLFAAVALAIAIRTVHSAGIAMAAAVHQIDGSTEEGLVVSRGFRERRRPQRAT
jgi:O-antigen biosynthesis protein